MNKLGLKSQVLKESKIQLKDKIFPLYRTYWFTQNKTTWEILSCEFNFDWSRLINDEKH
jgi:hypothetical protein